jgi:hypothetical protein
LKDPTGGPRPKVGRRREGNESQRKGNPVGIPELVRSRPVVATDIPTVSFPQMQVCRSYDAPRWDPSCRQRPSRQPIAGTSIRLYRSNRLRPESGGYVERPLQEERLPRTGPNAHREAQDRRVLAHQTTPRRRLTRTTWGWASAAARRPTAVRGPARLFVFDSPASSSLLVSVGTNLAGKVR